jgi:hypothetical protein
VNGLVDSVTWMFPDGPRQAISMQSTFNQKDVVIKNGAPLLPQSHQRALNWSAVRDEVQDFTRNIRAVSGGGGLIVGIPEGAAGLGQVPDLTPVANTGRSANMDAIATYLALGVRAPIAPVSSKSPAAKRLRVVRDGGLPEPSQRSHLTATSSISCRRPLPMCRRSVIKPLPWAPSTQPCS